MQANRHLSLQRATDDSQWRCRIAVKALEADSEEADEVEDVVEPQNIIQSNPQFAAVFKGALQRRGKDALSKGAKPADEK